jgi:hypothetical protein
LAASELEPQSKYFSGTSFKIEMVSYVAVGHTVPSSSGDKSLSIDLANVSKKEPMKTINFYGQKEAGSKLALAAICDSENQELPTLIVAQKGMKAKAIPLENLIREESLKVGKEEYNLLLSEPSAELSAEPCLAVQGNKLFLSEGKETSIYSLEKGIFKAKAKPDALPAAITALAVGENGSLYAGTKGGEIFKDGEKYLQDRRLLEITRLISSMRGGQEGVYFQGNLSLGKSEVLFTNGSNVETVSRLGDPVIDFREHQGTLYFLTRTEAIIEPREGIRQKINFSMIPGKDVKKNKLRYIIGGN